MTFRAFYNTVEHNLNQSTDKQVRLHFLACKRWFQWTHQEDTRDRQEMIDAILGADPIAVEGGALDFYASRRLMPKRMLTHWRKHQDD